MVGRLGALRDPVVFQVYAEVQNAYGGFTQEWTDHYACRAAMIYHRGGEGVEAARFQGSRVYKVKIRSSAKARAITTDMRMRDVHRSITYNVREVDPISDRAWVYVVVESGVAA